MGLVSFPVLPVLEPVKTGDFAGSYSNKLLHFILSNCEMCLNKNKKSLKSSDLVKELVGMCRNSTALSVFSKH